MTGKTPFPQLTTDTNQTLWGWRKISTKFNKNRLEGSEGIGEYEVWKLNMQKTLY